MTELNQSIAHIEMPARIARLPISTQGFPIPWFVPFDRNGEPVPQAADPTKIARAHRTKLCWCCGQTLGRYLAFPIGPMCAINRISSEPPSHRDCAEYAVRACPFLTRPKMRRNPTMPEAGKIPPAGIMIERNPGVVLLWITRSYRITRDHDGGALFQIGDPVEVQFYREGRKATRAEIMESIETGLPYLRKIAEMESRDAVSEMEANCARALQFVPQD